jgi:aminopeptidase N
MKRMYLVCACLLTLICLANAQRLPETARPESYKLSFTPDLEKSTFTGEETINVSVLKQTSDIVLNAVDIEFQEVSITSGGKAQKAQVALEKDKEQATFTVSTPLAPGSAAIRIKYSGILNNELRGFYAGKQDDGHRYAATQLEATDARRAFPSFDEPAYKATFEVTVVADKGLTVISNTKAVSDVDGPTGKHTVRFAQTPKMSSYLVAMVVGNFEYVEGSADGIPIRVYTNPGKKDLATFGLEAAETSLRYFDKYFGVKYPYGKLDMIALSDFGPGAMENTGCITYRESFLLLDDKHAGMETKRFIANVIAHEIAHQWLGDLVTMQWWDDIWLNEGFASWMASKPVAAWKPEWRMQLSDTRDDTGALNIDSLEHTHPIHQDANTVAEILELADEITYDKTAAVLRMLEAYLGEDTFRAGVNNYIKQHANGNATAADFWTALAKVSNKPVDKVMATFVEQPGPPMVSVKTQCEGSSLKVSLQQQRYFYDRARFQAGNSSELWQVPVCVKAGASSAAKCELLTQRTQDLTLAGCSPWINVNAGAHGFYRSGYDSETVRALAKAAETRLSPEERIMLTSDVWASVRVDREKIGDYLTFAQGLQSDRTPEVIQTLVAQLDYIANYVVSDADARSYRDWVRDLFAPIAADIGWETKPGESPETKDLRSDVLRAMGGIGHDPAAIDFARKTAERALQDPTSVDAGLAAICLRIAAENGDETFYENVLAHVNTAKTPEQKSMYRDALVSFSDPKLLEKTLQYAVRDARSQDSGLIVGRVMRNPHAGKLAWNFVRSRWNNDEKTNGAFGGSSSAGLVASTGAFCDSGLRDEVKDFFASHPVASAERTLKQSLERINYCIDMKARQGPELSSWLQDHRGRGAGRADAVQ